MYNTIFQEVRRQRTISEFSPIIALHALDKHAKLSSRHGKKVDDRFMGFSFILTKRTHIA